MTSTTDSKDVPVIVNTDDTPIRFTGYIILFIMFGIFGTWSAIAPIDSSSLATGSVSVKHHRKTVQHLEGGIVSKIHVHDGDVVEMGQPLITLDDTQIKAQIKILQGQYITATVVNARLNAERQHKKRIKFPEGLSVLNDNRVNEAIVDQQQVFKARNDSFTGEINLLKQRVEQLDLKIEGLEKQQENKQLLLASYADEIKDLNELLAEGFADKQRLRELERNHTQTNSDIASLTTEIASAQMQQGETELQILQTKRKFQEEIATQLEEVNNELFSINEQLIVAQDKGQRTIISAPVQGIVLGMSTHTEGGVILAGHPILDIVPEGEELVINAQVSLIDIDRVQIGDIAEVRFSAFSSKTTPVMEGRIQKISADSLQDEKTGLQYYEATIELTDDSEVLLGDLVLVPGMPAEVLINTGKRTLFEYLVQPISDAFARSFIEE